MYNRYDYNCLVLSIHKWFCLGTFPADVQARGSRDSGTTPRGGPWSLFTARVLYKIGPRPGSIKFLISIVTILGQGDGPSMSLEFLSLSWFSTGCSATGPRLQKQFYIYILAGKFFLGFGGFSSGPRLQKPLCTAWKTVLARGPEKNAVGA